MPWRARLWLLGGRFEFESDCRPLLRLIDFAYRKLPAQRLLPHAEPFSVRLRCSAPPRAAADGGLLRAAGGPPGLKILSGPRGLLCAVMEARNFVLLSPRDRAALIVISRDRLRQPYHVRYELIEFSVFTLAARAQGLVPLHAACMGRDGRGLLLIGASGAGKSTLALHGMLQGLELLAEDAVFVRPAGLAATGVANFLHLRRDGLRFIDDAAITRRIERSPVIRRRSGVEKFEVDLRGWPGAISKAPMVIEGVVFLSPRSAGSGGLIVPLRYREMWRRLRASQPYAATQPGWARFGEQLARLPAFELRRAAHPSQSALAIAQWLR
jgi:hypothetical protein